MAGILPSTMAVQPLNTLAAPGSVERRRKLAEGMLGYGGRPIHHWLEGVGDLANNFVGALQMRKAEREEKAGKEAGTKGTQALLEALLSKGAMSQPGIGSDAVAAPGSQQQPAPGGNRQALLDAFMGAQGNEWVDPGIRDFALKQLATSSAPPEYDFMESGGNIFRTDPRAGSFERIYEAPKEPEDAYTLGKGDIRFGPGNEEIARGLPPSPDTVVNIGPTGIDYGEPESGLAWARSPDGTVKLDERGAPIAVPYQGGKPYLAEQAAAEKGAITSEQEQRTSDIVTQDVDRAVDIVKSSPTFTTGLFGQMLQGWGGSQANDARSLIDTVKANVGFDRLQQMRAASPTGGALGPVSDFENRMLQSVVGSLDQSQTSGQLVFNLRRVKAIYEKIINEGIKEGDPMPTGEETGLPEGVSEEDIQHTMQLHGLTREQVLEKLNAP